MRWAIDPPRVSLSDEVFKEEIDAIAKDEIEIESQGAGAGKAGGMAGDEGFKERTHAARQENVKRMFTMASQRQERWAGTLDDDGDDDGDGKSKDSPRSPTAATTAAAGEAAAAKNRVMYFFREQSESARDFLNTHIRGGALQVESS
jgi:hypothetical protein